MTKTPESSRLEDLAQRVSRAYLDLPHIAAGILTGSVAAGEADGFSDLDIILYHEMLPSDAELAEAWRSNGSPLRVWRAGDPAGDGFMEAYRIDDVECQFAHTTVAAWEREMADVLERFNHARVTQKALEGLLHSVPLVGEARIRQWQERARRYPDGLGRAMIQNHLDIFPLWAVPYVATRRDATIWWHEMLVEASYKVLAILAGLNGVYFSKFQFKRMNAFCARLERSPPDVSRRLEVFFGGSPAEAAEALETLVRETLDMVNTDRPEIDTSALRDKIGKRRISRPEESADSSS
jgi:hypothetical protein